MAFLVQDKNGTRVVFYFALLLLVSEQNRSAERFYTEQKMLVLRQH